MNKFAEMTKQAEVTGAIAAFVDAGHIKVASEEAFQNLVADVCNVLGDGDYDLQKVAQATDYVLDYYNGGTTMYKTAAERHDMACKAALGELMMMKVAGQIDNFTFASNVDELIKAAANIGKMDDASEAMLNVANIRNRARNKRVPDTGKIFVDDSGTAVAEKMIPKQSILSKLLGRTKHHFKTHANKYIGAGIALGSAGAAGLGPYLYDKYNAD